MTGSPRREGGCACGAARYAVRGDPRRTTHCHCRDCRKSSGAAFVTWSEFDRSAFEWTAGEPASRSSRPGATRSFCGGCGTPLTFRDETQPETIDVTSATLDDPASVTPEDEVWTDREIPWATLLDDLPRHPRGRRGRRDADAGWSVYVVRTVDDRLYAGIATDVDRRFEEHRTGGPRAAKFLRAHPPAELAWSLPVGSKSLALKAEHRFKRLSRAEKEKVIGAPHVRIDPETGAWTVSGWTFRDATPEDLPTIVGWLADDPFGATRESVVAGPPDPRYARAFAEILADPNHTVVLAIGADGTPLGCLQWSRLPNLTYTGGPRAQIEGVRVAPEARGRGVGGALIGEAVRRAQDADCVLVQLTTDRRRPEAARFYSRAGFRATHHGMKLRLPDGPVVEP